MNIISILLIGISLSLDAFSLALAYGLFGVNKKQEVLCSFSVGIFHFFMPLIGYNIGSFILKMFKINPKYLLCIIFLLLFFQIIKNIKEEIKYSNLNIINIILFSFFVSIDSFTVGIGLNAFTNNKILCCILFTILSFLFTLSGFILGKIVNKKFGVVAKIIASIILLSLFITTLF